MREHIIILLMLLPVMAFGAAISLISESPQQVVLRFRLPEYKLEETSINGLKYQQLACEEGNIYALEGKPQLWMFTTALGLPVDGNATVSIRNVKSRVEADIAIMPSLTLDMVNGEPEYKYKPDFAAYQSRALYPANAAELGETAFIGDRKFVSLNVYPFQYEAGSRKLHIHSEFELVVNLSGSKGNTENWQLKKNLIDNAADAFFINNATSQKWRLPQTRDNSYESPKNSSTAISEIQFIVDTEGIYKVTYSALKDFIDTMTDSLGIEMSWNIDNVDPRYLELNDEDGQVPIHFVGEEDGRFGPDDYFEFYGDRHYGETRYYDDYTAENVYTLALKGGYGARMVVENGGLTVSNPLGYYAADYYEETVHFEKQLVKDKLGKSWDYDSNYYREDVWFWQKIKAPNLEVVPLELEYPYDSQIRTASAKILLQGLTYIDRLPEDQYDHEASIRLNQAMINTHSWQGQKEQFFYNQQPIANSFLKHGTNNLYISLSGNTEMGDREQVLLDYAEITYWREYKTSRDYIKFEKPSYRPNGLFQFDLEGFSSPNVSVYKIGSSIFSNLQIEPFNVAGNAPWTVSLQDSISSQAVRYYAVEEGKKKAPKMMRLNIPSDLKNPVNGADVIVITPYQFVNAEGTTRLVNLWESEGHLVKVVDIQDIYDEFNSGIVSAEAIRDFLKYAYNNWQAPQLSHVMLLGEGVDDSRDNSPSRKYNLIPVKMIWTYKHGATASDTWYGCIVGDDPVPDIVISRLNVWETQQIDDYAEKAETYRNRLLTNQLWNNHITFTAGGKIDDGHDKFAQQSELIRRRTVPKEYRVTRVYTSTQTVSQDYFGGTFALKDAINSGTQYVQFMGHGGGRVWADYNLFHFKDVETLNNRAYPVVLSLACYASAFDTNGASSISEALVLQPNKGAIATLGFSGLGYLDHDETWGLAYCEAAFGHDFANLGEAYLFALARYFSTVSSPAARDALTYGSALLGDPLIRLNKPIMDTKVEVSNLNPQPGDSIAISAQFPGGVNAARIYVMNENETVVNIPYDLPVVNGSFTTNYVVPQSPENAYRQVLVAGYSSVKEYVGKAAFGIGRPGIMHHSFVPAIPAFSDSVSFKAKLFSPLEIESMTCLVRTDSLYTTQGWVINWEELPMQELSAEEGIWETTVKLRKFPTGKELPYKYRITSTEGEVFESVLDYYQVAGPDLSLTDIVFDISDNVPKLKVKSTNIGNTPSLTTDLRLYYAVGSGNFAHASTQDFAPLQVNEERWDTIYLENIPNGNLRFQARVNIANTFSEWHMFINTNNYITLNMPYNYFMVDSAGGEYHSVDNNLSVVVPSAFVAGGEVLMAINTLDALPVFNQPDVHPVLLQSLDGISGNQHSIPYEISLLNSDLVDSLGVFTNGKRLELTFKYALVDEDDKSQDGANSFKIYRYNAEYQKWILIGGHHSATETYINFEVTRSGIYSIFQNLDKKAPTMDVNVQDQEFTIGGYVAGDGIVSLLLSDANGIDVIDNSIKLYMDGLEVSESDFVISINKENINRVPIKYQLALGRGTHELKVDCRDLNGNFSTREVSFVVNDKFNISNIGNYPNPVLGKAQDPKNDGRTRFTYVLTDTADEVYIKVYTISGRLVKTFRDLPTGVGYHEYPRTVYAWDCKDDMGYTLANGTYFYRVVARKGNKKIEKTMKMAILR